MLDPNKIPKFKSMLDVPSVLAPQIIRDPETQCELYHAYVITASRFYQQMLPKGFPKTELFGYGGRVYRQDGKEGKALFPQTSVPGPTIIAKRGVPVTVRWINELYGEHPLAVDPTICWADPNNIGMIEPSEVPPFPPGLEKAQKPIPMVTHLHGGESSSVFDGHPEAWFTPNQCKIGPTFTSTMTE